MKKGVTLMALALTITIMFTLLGLVIPQSYRTTTQAKLASFAMDIKQIEEALAVSVYNNDKGPIGKEVTREEVLNSLTEEKANAIINEFNINSDVDTKVFNILDINKLQITNKDKYKNSRPQAIPLCQEGRVRGILPYRGRGYPGSLIWFR